MFSLTDNSSNSPSHPSSCIFASLAVFFYFFFANSVKFITILSSSTKTAELTKSRTRASWLPCLFPLLSEALTSFYRISHTSFKSGQRQLVMKNKPGALSQSEKDKYF